MEIDNLLIQILEIIAWPLVVIIIALVFRSQFGRVILTLSRVKYRGFEVEFGKDLKDAESKAKELQLPTPAEARSIPEPVVLTSTYDRLSQVAEISPRAAVTEAWLIVEASTTEAARAQGIEVIRARTGREVISNLEQKVKLQKGTIELYDNLRRMRNNAAHSLEFEIDRKDAMRYIDIALSLAHRLHMLVNK